MLYAVRETDEIAFSLLYIVQAFKPFLQEMHFILVEMKNT